MPATRALLLLARAAAGSAARHLAFQQAVARAPAGALQRFAPPFMARLEQAPGSALWQQQARLFASGAGPGSKERGEEDAAAAEAAGAEGDQGLDRSIDQLEEELKEREASLEAMQAQVQELTDSFKRSLAEMENLRQRTTRQVEQANKFAVQGFAKAMLDVADNLQRAAEAVPGEVLDEGADVDRERALHLLRGLLAGVQLTNNVLLQALKQNGVEQFDPTGSKFDPNLHNAMFEVPDPSKEPGTVAVVTKRGYTLHDRVLRAAECGVVRTA